MLQYRTRVIGLGASVRRLPLSDRLALGALAIVAWSAAGFLLRDDLFIYCNKRYLAFRAPHFASAV